MENPRSYSQRFERNFGSASPPMTWLQLRSVTGEGTFQEDHITRELSQSGLRMSKPEIRRCAKDTLSYLQGRAMVLKNHSQV